jgi:hypothetical protein
VGRELNALTSPSIPTTEAVKCLDCEVVFSSRNGSCPKCASVIGLVPVETDAPAKEIARLRDREAWVTAAFLQIAIGLHDAEFKAKVAKKALAYLRGDAEMIDTHPQEQVQ